MQILSNPGNTPFLARGAACSDVVFLNRKNVQMHRQLTVAISHAHNLQTALFQWPTEIRLQKTASTFFMAAKDGALYGISHLFVNPKVVFFIGRVFYPYLKKNKIFFVLNLFCFVSEHFYLVSGIQHLWREREIFLWARRADCTSRLAYHALQARYGSLTKKKYPPE